jgi:hypothetical protein
MMAEVAQLEREVIAERCPPSAQGQRSPVGHPCPQDPAGRTIQDRGATWRGAHLPCDLRPAPCRRHPDRQRPAGLVPLDRPEGARLCRYTIAGYFPGAPTAAHSGSGAPERANSTESRSTGLLRACCEDVTQYVAVTQTAECAKLLGGGSKIGGGEWRDATAGGREGALALVRQALRPAWCRRFTLDAMAH